MNKLKRFSVKAPLTYNTTDIRSGEEDSQFLIGLEHDITWTSQYNVCEQIPEFSDCKIDRQETMHFRLQCGWQDEEIHLPESRFVLNIENVVAHNQEEAERMMEQSIHNICRVLSFQMNVHNCNKQGYQPRVQVNQKNVVWKENVYEPYEEVMKREESEEYIDENGNRVICVREVASINIETSVSATIFCCLKEEEFFKLFNVNMDEKMDFILEEYFIALGVEKMTSKFFHLFSIIEFVEKEYVSLAEADRLISDEDIEQVIEIVEGALTPDKRERILGTLKGQMMKMTNIGRTDKLVNILHAMNIMKIDNCAIPFDVNKKVIRELIDMRNRCFHGNGASGGAGKHISVELAVTQLLEICQRIIQYRMNI